MDFISKIIATDANLERAKLFIPNISLPATVHGLGKLIVEEYKPTGWKFRIHIYNTIDFGEIIEALQYAIHICR